MHCTSNVLRFEPEGVGVLRNAVVVLPIDAVFFL